MLEENGGPSASFSTVEARFRTFLAEQGWPATLALVPESHVLLLPNNAVLLLRPPTVDDVRAGELAYGSAQRQNVPAEMQGLGYKGGLSFAFVRVIRELAQGEDMFIQDGLKLSLSSPPRKLHFSQSRLAWRFFNWAERRRMRKLLESLRGAA